MRRARWSGFALSVMLLFPVMLSAQSTPKYDGSVPLLCVPTIVMECLADGPEGECKRRTPASVNLPQFINVDLKAMKVHSDAGARHSPIRNVEHLNGSLIIQGGQEGRGWTLTIAEETGRMSATISADGEGFVVFGACTPS